MVFETLKAIIKLSTNLLPTIENDLIGGARYRICVALFSFADFSIYLHYNRYRLVALFVHIVFLYKILSFLKLMGFVVFSVSHKTDEMFHDKRNDLYFANLVK